MALPAPTVLLTQEDALLVPLLLEDTLIVVLEEAVGELEAALTVAAPLKDRVTEAVPVGQALCPPAA